MMKILLVLNKPNREIPIMESIRREILSINPDAVVEITKCCVRGFNRSVFKFKPDVVLTFPFTCEGFSHWYYLFKMFLGVKIISFRAEGVIDFSSEYNLKWAVGMDRYGSTLVDYELFWGEKLAEVVGKQLLMQGKISSMERVKVTGYPRLENYFDSSPPQESTIPERVKQKLEGYSKENTVLIITGFQLANYTREDLINAKDLVHSSDPQFEETLDMLLNSVEMAKRFRQIWVENVIKAARENPEALIVLKKHPVEKKEDYEFITGINNILIVYEDILVHELLPYTGIFFHYGSSALVDAYLSKTPSVYVYTEESKLWYPDLGWPSSLQIEVNEMPQAVRDFLAGKMLYHASPDIKRVLKEVFNIEEGKPYKPSREIAEIILDPTPPQKIQISDPYFWKALGTAIIMGARSLIVGLIKRVLRIDPNVSMLKRKRFQ